MLLFVGLPVVMAVWVSVSGWRGRGSPFASGVPFVGLDNYRTLLAGGGLATQDLGTALRNDSWYVVLVVPLQTVVALLLAVAVNRRTLRGRGSSGRRSPSPPSRAPWPSWWCSSSCSPPRGR